MKFTQGARKLTRFKSNLRFLGRCPPVLGLVARQFLVGRPFFCHETCLVQASSDFVAGCVKARVEPSVPKHVGLMFHGIRPAGQRVPVIKIVKATTTQVLN